MENGGAKRITISAIAAAAVLGTVGGVAQRSAGYALQASGGDAWAYRNMVSAMDEVAHFLSSPLFIILASAAAGIAIYSWVDLIVRKWRERWQLTERLSFSAPDRKLVAMTLMLFFGSAFALTALWVAGERFLAKPIDGAARSTNSPVTPAPSKLALADFEQRRVLLNSFFKLTNGQIRSVYDAVWPLYNDQPRLINTNQKAVFQALEQVRSGLIAALADLEPIIRDSESYPDIRNLNWNFEQPLLGILNEMISRLTVPVQGGVVVHVDSKETDELKTGISALGKWIETTKGAIQNKKANDDAAEIIGTRDATGSKANPSGASFLILASPPELEGSPLGWQKSPYLGWQKQNDGSIQARTIGIQGKNIGEEEVQLTDAYIVSGITGRRLNLNIFGRNPNGTGSMTAPKDTHPIPPNANMQLSTEELNGTAGIQENDFLKEWGTIYFTTEYNGEKHRITYDRKIMEALFEKEKPKPAEPHVARRQ
jgi:hypothetical protein